VASALPVKDKLLPVDEAAVRQLITANRGKVVLLSFWATWCEPCRAEMPQIVALEARLRPKGLKILVISADEPEQEQDAFRFVSEQRVPQPAYIKRTSNDDAFINSIDAKWSGALPALFLYDQTGKRVESWVGEAEIKDVEARINSLLVHR
jgi:thiol-disulfide isomerase/thioredoxin